MIYRRNEPYRYVFDNPIYTAYHITKINDQTVQSSKGEGYIIDISSGGVKLETALDIPLHKTIEIFFTFTVGSKELVAKAVFLWKKKHVNVFRYGLRITTEAWDINVKDIVKEYKMTQKADSLS
ncbi:PilZ domain-containing protein [Bacillus sp. HMF5848]|uniref:PilZ domain-containing protein n=1 Tax=Bacillus sp. HMF5848 TaxID=2495421 RepID=UPI000F76DE03|nr:PilZ domain-containing protein [Bacillus sp. HMF5848]RSK29020.1 PilZ domain-containing protein [Bacillus sp. HMF5848]